MITNSRTGGRLAHVEGEQWRAGDGPSGLSTGIAKGADSVLERIAAGDESAVGECIERYGALVWRMARRRLGRFPGDVEDAVQEVFVELWQCAERFDAARGCEQAFVATVAHRRLVDHHRRAAARASGMGRWNGPRMNGEERRPGRGPAGRVRLCIDDLPEDERRAVWMWARGGLSHTQIAAATSSPVGTVKTRLRRAFGRLEEAMREDGLGWVA